MHLLLIQQTPILIDRPDFIRFIVLKIIQDKYNQWEDQFDGLYFAGNFRRGIGLGDAVLSAHETVQKILKDDEN